METDTRLFYVVQNIDPILSNPPQRGRIRKELMDTFDTEENARTRQQELRRSLRFAGTNAMYYSIDREAPPIQPEENLDRHPEDDYDDEPLYDDDDPMWNPYDRDDDW